MREPVMTTSSNASCDKLAVDASAAESPAALPIAIRMARAKDVDFFTIDPRHLRKYDNRGAIVLPEIYTYRSMDCYCGSKRTPTVRNAACFATVAEGQIDLSGTPSYDARASGHGAVW
jgi:hypothetical protein